MSNLVNAFDFDNVGLSFTTLFHHNLTFETAGLFHPLPPRDPNTLNRLLRKLQRRLSL